MTLDQIKAAVEAGKTVYVGTTAYEVIKDKIGQWLIVCTFSDYCIGLTWRDGVTMNDKPDRFFLAGDPPPPRLS